jgi:anti-sigma-K factor RskA
MSWEETRGGDDGGDDALAAEYVLGVLDHAERTQLAARLGRDAGFARLVADWEVRLGGLDDDFPEVTPPAYMQARVAARIFATAGHDAERAGGFWQSVAFWRGFAAAALAGLAALAFFTIVSPVPQAPGAELVALIAPQQAGDTRFVALYDPASHDLRITRVSGAKPAGKDHELWLIGADGKPVSLGLVGGAGAKAPNVAEQLRPQLREGATLAVSLEEEGGSVTGAPAEVVGIGTVSRI